MFSGAEHKKTRGLFFLEDPSQQHHYHMGLDARKPVFRVLQTIKVQTSLRIRAAVILLLKSITSKFATSKFLIF